MKRILFVCHGNLFRSVVAERIFKNLLNERKIEGIDTSSRGLQGSGCESAPQHLSLPDYPEIWASVKPVLDEIDVDIESHKAVAVRDKDIIEATCIIALDEKTLRGEKNSLLNQFPLYSHKMIILRSIADPYQEKDVPAEKIVREINELVHSNFEFLCNQSEL
jgi:protein-tyrosine-phosphatase